MFRLILVALITCAAASPLSKRANGIPIGFRTVGPYQSDGNKIIWQGGGSSSDQLGPGAYLSPSLGEWAGQANGWYCAILADQTAFDNVNKVYVPEVGSTNTCAFPLWFAKGVANRPTWLNNVGGAGYTTANTILVSEIEGYEPQIQFLIPPALLTADNPLGIQVQCVEKSATALWQALSAAYGTIDWRSLQGLRGAP